MKILSNIFNNNIFINIIKIKTKQSVIIDIKKEFFYIESPVMNNFNEYTSR